MKTKTHSSLGIHEHLLTIVRKLPRDFEPCGRREVSVLVDGSFVRAKAESNDVDLILTERPLDERRKLVRVQPLAYGLGMSLVLEQTQPVPLAADDGGIIRVPGTRVTLETVVHAFERGATAEEIVQQYPSLALADVYDVLGYVLRHQADVATYLDRRAAECAAVRQENERRFDPQGVRARLLARRV